MGGFKEVEEGGVLLPRSRKWRRRESGGGRREDGGGRWRRFGQSLIFRLKNKNKKSFGDCVCGHRAGSM